jgi:hypothetical protein
MPTFIAEFMDLKFDANGYRKSVDALMEQQMRMAARAWLRAVIPHVPVYTGMARGSLRPLGQFLKVSVPISPIATRKGMGIGAGESKSWFKISKSGGNYTFEYNSSVAHYEINEFYNVPLPLTHPTPWHSFKYGDEAFNEYARTKMPPRIPRVQDFIKVGSIIVSR